jgi:competence protein ComEC
MRPIRFLVLLACLAVLYLAAGCGLFTTTPVVPSATLTISFLDVGQADSILVRENSYTLLIDAGTNEGASRLVSTLKQKGVVRIDTLIGTHPHEDHIGGLDSVIKNFDIGKVYLPDVTSNTKTYLDVLTAINDKHLKISVPQVGQTFTLEQSVATFLAPQAHAYDDLNNYSIVIRLQYGDNSFLFTGDAQSESEKEMLTGGHNLKANVLKVGHHGSSSSTIQKFLQAVAPQYAVISVGKDNDYNHPSAETLEKLRAAGVKVLRTDRNGDITISTDGRAINVKTAR